MYSEEEFKNFDPFTPAEIHLVPLDSLILQMASLGLSDISNFPFLEQPPMKSLSESIDKLKFIGAIEMNDEGLELTPLGDALSQLPVEIHVGKLDFRENKIRNKYILSTFIPLYLQVPEKQSIDYYTAKIDLYILIGLAGKGLREKIMCYSKSMVKYCR